MSNELFASGGDAKQSLLDAIIARPEDDDLRLVYADWLEEHGEVRGEFIRLQCELSQLVPYSQAYFAVLNRSEPILQANREHWATELGVKITRKIKYVRGFPSILEVAATDFLKHGKRLQRATPLDWLRLPYSSNRVHKLVDSGLLEPLTGLNLKSQKLSLDEVQAMLQHVPNLKRLSLQWFQHQLDRDIANLLLRMPSRENLAELRIEGSSVAGGFFRQLGRSGGLPNLCSLRMGSDENTKLPDHFHDLELPSLQTLSIDGVLTIADIQKLTQRHGLKNIRLRHGRMVAQCVTAMIEAGWFRSAESIELINKQLGVRSSTALMASDLGACRYLNVGGNRLLNDKCWNALLNNPTISNLQCVVGNASTISPETRSALAERTTFHAVGAEA